MSCQILDGNRVAEELLDIMGKEINDHKGRGNNAPHLAIILVGNDAASQTYVAAKRKASARAGIDCSFRNFDQSVSESDLIEEIKRMNSDAGIDGLIVQLPLPEHIDEERILQCIDPEKDVDGFTPVNMGRMALGMSCHVPATPKGIIQLIRHYEIPTQGKHCVIVGRSHVVGMPLALLMSRNNMYGNSTVTICHSRTEDLKKYTQSADILVAALGKRHFITADMVKPGAVVIDVGIHRTLDDNGRAIISGDVDFEQVARKCSMITPVPGGVGAMTVVSLLMNTWDAARKRVKE
jgi:methylenetetrahydrofolate dehydrogenase (NADP+)/methenyltetrahydrofolate cyclohydrolase